MNRNQLILMALACGLAVAGCAADRGNGTEDKDASAGDSCSDDGATKCDGDTFLVCDGDKWTIKEECGDGAAVCDPAAGCLDCAPGEKFCDGNAIMKCDADGKGSSVDGTCDADKPCVDGACSDTCELAAQTKSYLGCKFIAVTTSNLQLATVFDSDFAVIIGNPEGASPAEIVVSRKGQVVKTATVAGGDTTAIQLPMVLELKNAQKSVVAKGAAYEITSSTPVVAYQFNPLHFSDGAVTPTYSYTNDASLLLPVHTLSGKYMASTWPTWGLGTWTKPLNTVTGSWSAFSPGFVTVAATEDGTKVTFTSSTHTADGAPAALEPGATTTVTLDRGDVVQIFSQIPVGGNKQSFCADNGWENASSGTCPPKNMAQTCYQYCSVLTADLTGSIVDADKPVAVFAGHQCTFMPFNYWACDHLEEMMFPLQSWGDSAVLTAPVKPDNKGVAKTMYRVLAKDEDTTLTFTPEVHAKTTLGAGEFLEFESDQDFVIKGTGPFYVTQTMEGQDALGTASGDPAMGSGVPVFQSRGAYSFLTPDTYTNNYLNVVATTGTNVTLDGSPVGGWQAITGTEYSVARVQVQPGAHRAASEDDTGFGITSYGYAAYTSYLYPGGMNVKDFVE